MARTLKEQYEFRLLKEKVTVVDKQLLEENRAARLIIEAMDQEDLDKVSAIVQKLETIKKAAGSDLSNLSNGIEQAQAELNKYTAGGPISKTWQKVKGKVGIDNPIVKITTFVNALERGFGQMPQIFQNNGIPTSPEGIKKINAKGAALNPEKITLGDALAFGTVEDEKQESQAQSGPSLNEKQFQSGSSSKADMGHVPSLNTLKRADLPKKKKENPTDLPKANIKGSGRDVVADEEEDDQRMRNNSKEKLDSVIKQIVMALSPSGVFGAFKKIPYVNGKDIAHQLKTTPLMSILRIAQAVRSGPQTNEIAKDIQQNVTGEGETETKNATPASTAQPAGQADQASPTKSTVGTSNSTPAGETPPGNRGGGQGGGGAQSQFWTKHPDTVGLFRKAGISDERAMANIVSGLVRMKALDPKKLT